MVREKIVAPENHQATVVQTKMNTRLRSGITGAASFSCQAETAGEPPKAEQPKSGFWEVQSRWASHREHVCAQRAKICSRTQDFMTIEAARDEVVGTAAFSEMRMRLAAGKLAEEFSFIRTVLKALRPSMRRPGLRRGWRRSCSSVSTSTSASGTGLGIPDLTRLSYDDRRDGRLCGCRQGLGERQPWAGLAFFGLISIGWCVKEVYSSGRVILCLC
jgi:hypothetical protein